ncbi:PREDICTED: uncharacterized protein LOC101386959 [Odobenus rosmarus divergens]|uniref:Uncharacterized protein LOC101386959 n=1 Tax=Odobenus rosmarus divergens TaxID=9708 RepID=A0A9B0HH70_ODORO
MASQSTDEICPVKLAPPGDGESAPAVPSTSSLGPNLDSREIFEKQEDPAVSRDPDPQDNTQPEAPNLGAANVGQNILGLSFPRKLWSTVEDNAFTSVRWDDDGDTVIIDEDLFQREVLHRRGPERIFETDSLKGFIRLINLYGFSKIRPDSPSVRAPGNERMMAGHPGPGPVLAPVGPLFLEAAAFSPTRPRSWLGRVEAGPGRPGRLSLACPSGETTASLLTLALSPFPALTKLETGGAFLVGPLVMPGRVSDQQLSTPSAGARGLSKRPTEKQGRRTPLVELRRHRPFHSMAGAVLRILSLHTKQPCHVCNTHPSWAEGRFYDRARVICEDGWVLCFSGGCPRHPQSPRARRGAQTGSSQGKSRRPVPRTGAEKSVPTNSTQRQRSPRQAELHLPTVPGASPGLREHGTTNVNEHHAPRSQLMTRGQGLSPVSPGLP